MTAKRRNVPGCFRNGAVLIDVWEEYTDGMLSCICFEEEHRGDNPVTIDRCFLVADILVVPRKRRKADAMRQRTEISAALGTIGQYGNCLLFMEQDGKKWEISGILAVCIAYGRDDTLKGARERAYMAKQECSRRLSSAAGLDHRPASRKECGIIRKCLIMA